MSVLYMFSFFLWSLLRRLLFFFFFFNDTATTEIYTLSLHDALPIYHYPFVIAGRYGSSQIDAGGEKIDLWTKKTRSEEHTSELQSRLHLVCRLLLEKKKKKKHIHIGDVAITEQEITNTRRSIAVTCQ